MRARYSIGIVGMVTAVASWIAVGVGFVIQVDRQTWVILVVIAAVATEAMMWCMATALGLTLLQARRKLWRWVVQRFTMKVEHTSRLEK